MTATMCVSVSVCGGVGAKTFWYDNHVDEGETPATTYINPSSRPYVKLTGVGFEPRFHPDANGQLKCEFAVKGKRDKDVSPGTIKSKVSSAGSYYHVECQVPAFPKGTVVTMKLFEHDGTEIPFRGGNGCDSYEVQPLCVRIARRPVRTCRSCAAHASWCACECVRARHVCCVRPTMARAWVRALRAEQSVDKRQMRFADVHSDGSPLMATPHV